MKSVPSTAWSPSLPQPPSGLPPLIQALTEYDRLQRRRFHMPAHAGRLGDLYDFDPLRDPYRYDLTELDGLDVLSEPSGCIQESQAQLATLFGAAHSFFLVNGASVGLMAAMLSVVQPGDKVLLPRNVHRSVLSGLILTGAEPVWILPERLPDWGLWGAVSPETVRDALAQHPDIKALFVTSPTYEGIGSNIAALSELCKAHGIYLVVDEAHGGLWPFSDDLPTSAVRLGADAVIHSIHKSGGCLTQGAIAHLPIGSAVEPAVFQQALNTLQTTSPSYLLMASIEQACHFLLSEPGKARIQALLQAVWRLRQTLEDALTPEEEYLHEQIPSKPLVCDSQQNQALNFALYEPLGEKRAFWDPCKLYLTHPFISGEEWGGAFESDLNIAYESASPYGVLYYASLGLEHEDFAAFESMILNSGAVLSELLPKQACSSVLKENNSTLQQQLEMEGCSLILPEMAMTPRDAFFKPGHRLPVANCAGQIAKETVVHCPPGIPVVFPGERIQAHHLPFLPESGVLVLR